MGNTKGRAVTSFAKTGLQNAFNQNAPHIKAIANPLISKATNFVSKGIDNFIDRGVNMAKQGVNNAINFAQEKVFRNKLEPKVVEQARGFASNLIDNGTRYVRQKKEQYQDTWDNKRPFRDTAPMSRNLTVEMEPPPVRRPAAARGYANGVQGLGDLTR